MKINKSQIGQRIQNLRQQTNLSMEDLANKVGASGKSTVNEWEKGRSTPNKEYLAKLSSFFGVSEDYIKFGEFKQYVFKVLENELKNENPKLQKSIEDYLNIGSNDYHGVMDALYTNEKYDMIDAIRDNYIKSAFDNNYYAIEKQLKKAETGYDDVKIVKTLITAFQYITAREVSTFLGMSNKLLNYLSDFDAFNIASAKTFEEYLNESKITTSNLSNTDIERQLNDFYEAKLTELILNMQSQVAQLRVDYKTNENKYLK